MSLYVNSNADIFMELCERNDWKFSSLLGTVSNSPIDRIDRSTGKYYLMDGTVGDIPKDIVLT